MGSKDKFYGIITAAHGFDDVGFAQPTGTINSVAALGGSGRYRKYAVVTTNAAHNFTKGQPVNISNSTDYDGPTRVLEVLSPTAALIKRAFSITKTGNWDLRTVEGNWDAIMPIGANVTGGTNVTFEFWKPEAEGGIESLTNLTVDKIYVTPGLKKVSLNSSGNFRLFRAASTRPGDGRNLALPTVVAYNPTSAAVGASVDVLGTNFDPIIAGNSVTFFNGKKAEVTAATEEILTVTVPSGAGATGVVNVVCNKGQSATGPVFTVNS